MKTYAEIKDAVNQTEVFIKEKLGGMPVSQQCEGMKLRGYIDCMFDNDMLTSAEYEELKAQVFKMGVHLWGER